MKLIVHIGMGKTGTSAIQLALSRNASQLRSQKAQYLGMWFNMIDAAFQGLANQVKFFEQTPETIRKQAKDFGCMLRERAQTEGTDLFIMSNEAFSGQSFVFAPFVEEIVKQGIEFKAIGYARNPRAWLPSAYVQWGVRDKINEGPVQPYAVVARTLVKWYNGLIDWSNRLGEFVEIRHYDSVGDIVHDFSCSAGIRLDAPSQHVYGRGEDCEILLRALFNNRFNHRVSPVAFDGAVIGKSKEYPTLDESIGRYFDYAATDQIIEENRELFDRFEKRCGIDLMQVEAGLAKKPAKETLRERLVEYLVEITLDQARRIDQLEKQVLKMTTQ